MVGDGSGAKQAYQVFPYKSQLIIIAAIVLLKSGKKWPVAHICSLLHEMSRAASHPTFGTFPGVPNFLFQSLHGYLHNQFSPDRIRNYSARIYIYRVLTKRFNTKDRQTARLELTGGDSHELGQTGLDRVQH